jgi:mono/diheme cytochrome c family protein
LLVVGCAISIALTVVSFSGAGSGSTAWSAKLTAAAEVPKQAVANAAASGSFSGTLSGSQLTFTLTFAHLTGPPTMAHIHLGAAGVSGPILVWLCGLGSPYSGVVAAHPCVSPVTGVVTVSAALRSAFAKQKLYVNIHTAKNPNGEIRGQLTAGGTATPPPPPTASVSAGKAEFTAAGCGACHTFAAARSKGTIGPNLDAANLTVAQIVKQITDGGYTVPGVSKATYPFPMSAFKGRLTTAQIAAVAAFVHLARNPKAAPPPTTTTTTSTTTNTTTTTPTTTVTNNGCPPGVTIQTSGQTDNDDDEGGGPTDNDGCV